MFTKRIPRDHKLRLIEQIQIYFDAELSMPIGQLAAENLLDFMSEHLGPLIYNQAVSDSRAVLLQQLERLDDDLYALEQPLK